MPRKPRLPVNAWGAAAAKADEALGGTVWRCDVHGATQHPIVLGEIPYCPADDCTAACRVSRNLMHKYVDHGFGFNASFGDA